LREQIVKILETAPDIVCVGACACAAEALARVTERKPDVVLMDIKLPDMSGIQCVVEIKKVLPATQIIMVTIYEDSERIFNALKAGASGYIIKSDSADQLLDAVRDVCIGGAPLSSSIARKVVKHFHKLDDSASKTANLTGREQEVLELLAQGLIYKEIGDKLNIAPSTVRTHVERICNKMHVDSRLEAVALHRVY